MKINKFSVFDRCIAINNTLTQPKSHNSDIKEATGEVCLETLTFDMEKTLPLPRIHRNVVESKIQNTTAAPAAPVRELATQHDIRACGDQQGCAFASEFSSFQAAIRVGSGRSFTLSSTVSALRFSQQWRTNKRFSNIHYNLEKHCKQTCKTVVCINRMKK